MTDPGLRAIAAALARIEGELAEQRGMLVALLERRPPAGSRADLVAAFEAALFECFGPGDDVTTGGLLRLADADPHGPVACALADLVDLGAPGRATAVGVLLSGLRGLRLAGSKRGSALYRLRT